MLDAFFTNAQVKFSASVTPDHIGKDEYAQLRLVVENAKDVQKILPPALNNFTIISGPNQESGMSMINGDVKKYIAVSFIIQPKSTGEFTIPSAHAQADGKEYRSTSVMITVSNASTGNNTGSNNFVSPFSGIDPFADAKPETSYNDDILRKGENIPDKIKNNIVVRLETDKTTCYVGEPVIATYKLYTRLKSESNLTKNPSFNGFSVIDLQKPDNTSYKTERLNGREYNVYTIRKAQLYPLQPGNLVLESAEIENNIHFIKEEYARKQRDAMDDIFRDFADPGIPPEGMEDHKVTLQSKPITILVKPLPDENKPADFKGAVGNFAIEASIAKKNFTTDDAGQLTLIISGVGNMQLVNSPEISWPKGIEGFEPKTTDDLFKTTVPVSGRKIIEYPFTITAAGNYSIPVISFSFFDPKEGRYKTVTTKGVSFSVAAGTGKPKVNNIVEAPKGNGSLLNSFFSNRLRVVSVVAMIIICGLIFWLKKERKKEAAVVATAMEKEKNAPAEEFLPEIISNQENPLAAAALSMNDGSSFYGALNQSLKEYISRKLGIPMEELNKKNISEKMDNRGIPVDVNLQLGALMDEIEWQLYTPSAANEQMQTIYEKAHSLVQLINMYKI